MTAQEEDVPRPTKIGIENVAAPAVPLAPYQENLWDSDYSEGNLRPTLSKNERQRLNALWYYTENLQDDAELLKRLKRTLQLAPLITSLPIAIFGLADSQFLRQMVGINIATTTYYRQDSLCSHTVNKAPHSMMLVKDLKADVRFNKSTAASLGMTYYAAVPVTINDVLTNQQLNLGSLCIVDTVARPHTLTEEQEQGMHQLASILTSDIVAASFLKRQHLQSRMAQVVENLERNATPDTVVELALESLRDIFPVGTRVSCPYVHSALLELHGRSSIPLKEIVGRIWEDIPAIEDRIVKHNHEEIEDQSSDAPTVRAIACKLGIGNDRCLVVESSKYRQIFTETEVTFVSNIARVVTVTLQQAALAVLREAKNGFLRGVQHQLRTPLHGLLSANELLREEVGSSITGDAELLTRMTSLLDMVDSAGDSLTESVNHLIDFDRLQDSVESDPKPKQHMLDQLEADVMETIMGGVPQAKLTRLDIIVDNQLPPDLDVIVTDARFYTQCLVALVKNALDYTEQGSIIIQISSPDREHRLVIDIIDTGQGIAEEDHERIFLPFEKVSPFSSASGLGLAIANRLAQAQQGTVSLITSVPNQGSHFRLTYNSIGLACSTSADLMKTLEDYKASIPLSYWQPGHRQIETIALTYLCTNLERLGFRQVDRHEAVLTVMQPMVQEERQKEILSDIQSHEIVLTLVTSQAEEEAFDRIVTRHHLSAKQFIAVKQPITRQRLHEVFKQAQAVYKERQAELPSSEVQAAEDMIKSTDAAQKTHAARKRSLSTLRLALVDDNPTNLKVLQMYSKKRNHPHVCCSDGLQAVQAYIAAWERQEPITLVMMDLQMPVCDGVTAVAKIREYERGNGVPPALLMMVTGLSSESDKAASVNAGADSFYVKPLSMRAFSDLIAFHFSAD